MKGQELFVNLKHFRGLVEYMDNMREKTDRSIRLLKMFDMLQKRGWT